MPFSNRTAGGMRPDSLFHLDGLQKLDVAEMALPPNRLGRQAALFAKSTGKSLVRTVSGVGCDGQNVSGLPPVRVPLQ